MKINWKYIKGILLFALIVFLYGFSHVRNSKQKVRKIEVEFEAGNNLFMDIQMVNKLLIQNKETVKNQTKSVIDLHKLESHVRAHPMVENATVFLTIDGVLKAKVKQRTPVARVYANGDSYYIDRQAKTMPLSKKYAARVLLISGNVEAKDSIEIYKLATTILNDAFLKKQIIGAVKTPKNEFVLSTRVGEQKIILGNLENLSQKLKNLKAFYKKTVVDKTIDKYRAINLKYTNQVVCTKK